nr:ribonuclease P protein component [Campylobacter sp.]
MNVGKFVSISENSEFSSVYKNAKKWYCECAVVYFLPAQTNKFAAVVSKKIGKAVIRNKCKRRIRTAFCSLEVELKCGIYVIVSKIGFDKLSYEKICSNLKWAFKKIECIK